MTDSIPTSSSNTQPIPESAGTCVAVTNIAWRIKLVYGERAKLKPNEVRGEYGALYRARLRLSLQFQAEDR